MEELLGDPSKAKMILGWEPEISFEEMCDEMILNDLKEAKRSRLLISHGHETNIPKE